MITWPFPINDSSLGCHAVLAAPFVYKKLLLNPSCTTCILWCSAVRPAQYYNMAALSKPSSWLVTPEAWPLAIPSSYTLHRPWPVSTPGYFFKNCVTLFWRWFGLVSQNPTSLCYDCHTEPNICSTWHIFPLLKAWSLIFLAFLL